MISSSVDASLRRLGTDHIDVLALHGAEQDEVLRDDILAALERIVRLGKAKTISIASSLESGLLGVAHSNIYRNSSGREQSIPAIAGPCSRPITDRTTITFVTHSAYGTFGALSSVMRNDQVEYDQDCRCCGMRATTGISRQAAAAFLADYALATNRAGITLFSMLKKEHLDFNLRRLEQLPAKARMEKLAQALIAT